MIVSPTNLVVFLESSSTPETFAIVIALVTSRVNFHAELHTFSYALNLGPNWETKTLTRLSNSRLSLPNSRLSLLPHRYRTSRLLTSRVNNRDKPVNNRLITPAQFGLSRLLTDTSAYLTFHVILVATPLTLHSRLPRHIYYSGI